MHRLRDRESVLTMWDHLAAEADAPTPLRNMAAELRANREQRGLSFGHWVGRMERGTTLRALAVTLRLEGDIERAADREGQANRMLGRGPDDVLAGSTLDRMVELGTAGFWSGLYRIDAELADCRHELSQDANAQLCGAIRRALRELAEVTL